MLTYGDMMSLLLCFFIAIVSFSTIEVAKYRAAMGSFRGALQSPWTKSDRSNSPISEPLPSPQQNAAEAEEIEEAAQSAGLTGVEMQTSPEGVRIILSSPVTFDEGSDELKPAATIFLTNLARMPVVSRVQAVMIEGHTDDTPIHTARFPSNWELSAARALRVLKLFQSEGAPPERLMAVGYGEYRPRKALPKDATREQKEVNRRIEIFLKVREAGGLFSKIPSRNDEGWGD
ncbi:MAG: hypothetical protein FJY65_10210 [Calditrichaeota bacterium]|nr:hypothetical protein [Calditrichota bacterium]